MDTPASEPWTIRKVLLAATDFLKTREIDTARLDAELLLADVLKCKRIQLYTEHDKPLSVVERETFKAHLRRRAMHEPVSYVLNEKDFYGRAFLVTQDVLIPRPETELLVEMVIDYLKGDVRGSRVLDVGSGSGCIGVTLAAVLPNASVTGWDVCEKALAVARRNANTHGAERIVLKFMDALQQSSWREGDEVFDVIVSNPPYIGTNESASLPKSVVQYEPARALFAGTAGYEFYEVFAREAFRKLSGEGSIFLEIGASQGEAIKNIFARHGWRDVRLAKDLAGLDRIVSAKVPERSQ